MYQYSVRKLKDIASCYESIYQGIEFTTGKGFVLFIEKNPWSIAEFKADFDMSLKHIGKKEQDIERLTYQDFRDMVEFLNGGK